MKAAVVVALVLAAGTASADVPNGPPPVFELIRELQAAGDYVGVRRELLKLYELSPQPQLLFALGQAELNLGNYAAAIGYYERFIASGPSSEQVALAQQAIGAARFRLAAPPATPVAAVRTNPEPPPEPRRWTLTHTGLVAFGGVAAVVGTGLLLYSRSLGNDRSGTLSQYDSRVDQARSTRWTGAGILATGTLLIGVTILW